MFLLILVELSQTQVFEQNKLFMCKARCHINSTAIHQGIHFCLKGNIDKTFFTSNILRYKCLPSTVWSSDPNKINRS